MHLGTARTAYFNWLAAMSHPEGMFFLRIDDTDAKRSDPKYTEVIFDVMSWLGLDYDEVIYQSQRKDFYLDKAKLLVVRNKARVANDGAIILHPEFKQESWEDMVGGKIEITFDDRSKINAGIPLIKKDGNPTYHFACVCDDIDMRLNLVIRGVDHITNTARQLAIYDAFHMTPPAFAHVGLIHKDGKPLSKRDGAASMLHYRDAGYDPDAMLNFMARLGWGPRVDDKTTKLLPRERMLELFWEGGKMRSSPANIDLKKLDSFDRKYKARK
jgi:glutamyl/glutaminyl-tRNA synthetase